jgi:hypothetical protein
MSVQVEIIIFIYTQLRTSCFLFYSFSFFFCRKYVFIKIRNMKMLRTRLQCYNPLHHHHHPKLVFPETWFQRNKSNFMSNSQLKLCSWERRCIVYWSFWMHFDCNLLFWLESTATSYHKNLTKKLQHHILGVEESLKYFISNPISFKSQMICWVLESENDDFWPGEK